MECAYCGDTLRTKWRMYTDEYDYIDGITPCPVCNQSESETRTAGTLRGGKDRLTFQPPPRTTVPF